MSVSVEQPLHFSQQLSTPSRSPTHLLHAHTSASSAPPPQPQPQPSADMDMSPSTNALPPTGQNHDRDDAEMQDEDHPTHRDASTNTVAVEISAIDDDDAMDVAQDAEPDALLLNSPPTQAPDTTIATPLSPVADDTTSPIANIIPPPPIDPGSVLPPPPPPALLNIQPPPPPPPAEPDTDSSDEDEGLPPWHPLQEDMSSPDEDELRYIEERGEHSALDHEHWEKEAFKPLEDPEYTAGETGRIHWTVDAYNGTQEKPNQEILMKSDVVTIGGHQWQIKFYPKGNDSEYLSVYLECLSVMDPKERNNEEAENGTSNQCTSEPSKEEKTGGSAEHISNVSDSASEQREEVVVESEPMEPHQVEYQHAPLPLLGSKKIPKRNSVAAQISVVLYNPTEPRVNYSRNALHRFCTGSPDWGWTRFHGPYFEICRRMHGQRMALLRDDKLAFTAYIRVIKDETGCLWEHPIRENTWDSFAMTGLQGLALGEDASMPGGNMISAVASWMLFKPFRQLLYSINVADPNKEPLVRPKPLVAAFQQVLYMLRTQVDPGAGAVALDDILDALDWYGIHEGINKLDVVETWEVLRLKLEEELQNTPHLAKLQAICGPKRNHSSGVPSYRVPVVGVETMQEAVNRADGFTVPGQTLPELLTIELERHVFDSTKTRSHIKLLNKVTLDDNITVNGASYTLYGFVVHKQTLQSYVYQPIIRPEGPGSRWYSYSDSKDENQVRCLPKRLAVDLHEGQPGTGQVVGNDPVAYIAMYIRNDVAQSAFVSDAESEQWEVPQWIKLEMDNRKTTRAATPPPPPPPMDQTVPQGDDEAKPKAEAKLPQTLDFQIIESRAFLKHEGPGLFDPFDPNWADANSELIHTVSLSVQDGCKDIRAKIMETLPDVKDPRQIKFWFLDPMRGSLGRPNLLGTGKIEFSAGSYDRYTDTKEWTLEESPVAYRRLWVHVTDYEKLPELPKDEEQEETGSSELPAEESSSSSTNQGPQDDVIAVTQPSSSPPPQAPARVEDTPMSEPEESTAVQIDPSEPLMVQIQDLSPADAAQANDTAMVEVESTPAIDPPAVDVVIPSATPGDTEMGGTQEERLPPPPPPPPVDFSTGHIQPPPPVRTPSPEPPADEIYFFLKFWNPETQTLESRGSHVTFKSQRVDETVIALLGLPTEDKKKMEMWEEEDIGTVRTLKHRRTFTQLDLHNTSVIIAGMPITAEQKSALAARAAFADPHAYLKFRSFARNFPHKLNGHFTYNYFSSEYYKGEIVNGYRHGHGTLIYHSGAIFNGSFRLNQRHGHGLYTFQNGDTYDGDWVDDQQHGTGTYIEATSGNTYVGGWQNDKKFGEGVTHWKNAQEAERLCRICWDGDAEAAFYDCGHVVACLPCAREVQSCPVCRKRVLSAMKLYYVA